MDLCAIKTRSDWGIPIDTYLERGENLAIRQYPLGRVLSAIEAITTKRLGEMICDTTLEAVISVVYYPECVDLLNAKGFRDVWSGELERYLAVYSASLRTR